jgi:hypothetical protein
MGPKTSLRDGSRCKAARRAAARIFRCTVLSSAVPAVAPALASASCNVSGTPNDWLIFFASTARFLVSSVAFFAVDTG